MSFLFFNFAPLISSFFTYRILRCFLVCSEKRTRRFALLVACFLLDGMIIYIGDWANMPPTFVFFLAAIFRCCEGSARKKLTLGITLSCAPFALNCLIDSFLDYPVMNGGGFLYQICKIVFWFLLWYAVRRLQFPNDFDLPVKYWNVLLLITCIPFLILLTLILVPDSSATISVSMQRTMICILILVILSIVGMLYAIYALYKAAMTEESKLLLEANDQYYKHLDSQMQQIRKLRHDMTNHLQVLSNLPEAERTAYITQLLADKAISTPLVYCRDSVLNAILSAKADNMEQSKLTLDYEISLQEDIPLSATDKCALFGNLMDNAIEGCSKVTGDRKISLKVTCSKGLFITKICNCSASTAFPSLHTTKKDSINHGFGLKSVKDVVERHHGSMEITREHGLFEVFIVLKLPGSSHNEAGNVRKGHRDF